MSLKQYIFLMLLGTVLCWGAWLLVIFYLDPDSAGWLGFAFFYSSLFLALVGSFALLGLGFRLFILRHEVVFRQVTIAFRQALSFAFVVVAALFLQSREVLTWWNMLFLIAMLTILEFAVVARKQRLPDF